MPFDKNAWTKEHEQRLHEEGKCKCGKPLGLYSWSCDACYQNLLERMRRDGGHQPWEPGKAGRHPFKFTQGLTRLPHRTAAKCIRCHTKGRVLYENGICLPCILEVTGVNPCQ